MMNYGMVNGHKKFKEASFDMIKNLWLNKEWKNNERFNLYVHSPFCVSPCNYCLHSGSKITIDSDLYKNFYNEYLPQEIKKFKEIILSHRVDAIYFGGGTASIMSSEVMENIFNTIPNFQQIPCKIFEAHPGLINDSKIDLLLKYDFTGGYVSFGVQSFDENVIKSQNRIYVSPEKLKEKAKRIQDNNIKINCDLLAFINGYELKHLQLLKDDLSILINTTRPEVITIYPLRQAFNIGHGLHPKNTLLLHEKNEQNKIRAELAYGLRSLIVDFINENKEYVLLQLNQGNLNDINAIVKGFRNPYYLIRISHEEASRIRQYSSGTPPYHFSTDNVLAFGSYSHRMPCSYLGDDIVYYTANDDWKSRYFIVHDANDPELDIEKSVLQKHLRTYENKNT